MPDNSKLPLFNRKPERAKFQRILRGQIGIRGLVVHSHGDGGWGKSDLLRIFLHECEACESPMTLGLFFDPLDSPDQVFNWRIVMDRTVNALGEKHFPRYINARGERGYKHGLEDNGDFDDMRGQVEIKDSNITKHTGDIAGTIIKQSFYGSEGSEELQTVITNLFFEELEAMSEPCQVVWLVDSLDWIDDETSSWLRKVFGRIANRRVVRTTLVVAGRDRLTYPTSWQGKIEEMDIRPFDKADILELFYQIGWVGDRRMCELAAEGLINKSGGKPLHICTNISDMLYRGEGDDV